MKLVKPLCAAAALSAFALMVCSQTPPKTSPEFRKAYLKKFPWTTANTTEGDAMFLRVMVESCGAKRGVEVGTNTGYGAINMGIAFERTGGHLISHDINPRMVQAAKTHLEAVGLDKVVTVVEGDALKTLPLLEGPIDFVFIDALKKDYLNYLKILAPKMKVGACLVADNVIDYAKDMPDFLEFMQSTPDWDVQIIRASMQKNDGMLVAYKLR